jgi:hypothetical protein
MLPAGTIQNCWQVTLTRIVLLAVELSLEAFLLTESCTARETLTYAVPVAERSGHSSS